jgi:MOSC domain-containing protein YiiM
LRVITPGPITSGAAIDVILRDPRHVRVADVNALYYERGALDMAEVARILSVPALSQSAQQIIEKRLDGPLFA